MLSSTTLAEKKLVVVFRLEGKKFVPDCLIRVPEQKPWKPHPGDILCRHVFKMLLEYVIRRRDDDDVPWEYGDNDADRDNAEAVYRKLKTGHDKDGKDHKALNFFLKGSQIHAFMRAQKKLVSISLRPQEISIQYRKGNTSVSVQDTKDLRQLLKLLAPCDVLHRKDAAKSHTQLAAIPAPPPEKTRILDNQRIIGKTAVYEAAKKVLIEDGADYAIVLHADSGHGKSWLKNALCCEWNGGKIADVNCLVHATADDEMVAHGEGCDLISKSAPSIRNAQLICVLQDVIAKLSGFSSKFEPQRTKTDLVALGEEYARLLAAESALVVLDNFVLQTLPDYLVPPHGSRSRLIVISRKKLQTPKRVMSLSIPGWNRHDILDYIQSDPSHIDPNLADDLACKVFSATDNAEQSEERRPLLVQNCLAFIDARSNSDPKYIQERANDFAEYLRKHSRSDGSGYGPSFEGLSPDERTALYYLSICPGWIDDAAIGALCPAVTSEMIKRYVNLHFLHEDGRADMSRQWPRPKSFYWMHDSAKAFFGERLKHLPAMRHSIRLEMRRRHTVHYLARLVAAGELYSQGDRNSIFSARLCQPHRRNLIDAQKYVGSRPDVQDLKPLWLVFALGAARLCDLYQPNRERLQWIANAQSVHRPANPDKLSAALWYAEGVVHRYYGKVGQAVELCELALDWHLRSYQPEIPVVAEILSTLGNLWMDRANYSSEERLAKAFVTIAERFHQQASSLLEEVYLSDDVRINRIKGIAAGNQAIALTRLGQWSEASIKLVHRKKLAVDVNDRRGQASGDGNLGLMHVAWWDHDEEQDHRRLDDAQRCYEAALIAHQEIDNKRGVEAVKANLALIDARRGNIKAAKEKLHDCKSEFETLGDEQTAMLLALQIRALERREDKPRPLRLPAGDLRKLHWTDKYLSLKDYSLDELVTDPKLLDELKTAKSKAMDDMLQQIAALGSPTKSPTQPAISPKNRHGN